MIPAYYVGGRLLESAPTPPQEWLSWRRCYLVFLSPSKHLLGCYHVRVVQHPCEFFSNCTKFDAVKRVQFQKIRSVTQGLVSLNSEKERNNGAGV
jgi:hypothetical protein